MPKRTPRTCLRCAGSYMPNFKAQQYCSHACARNDGNPMRACEVCGTIYRRRTTPGYVQRTCSRKCGGVIYERRDPKPRSTRVVWSACLTCNRQVPGRRTTNDCSPECRTQRLRTARRLAGRVAYQANPGRFSQAAHRRRSLLLSSWVEDVDLAVLHARDGGRCGICRRPVSLGPHAKRHPLMPSIDHVLPVSQGGEHSYANTRLTHYRCNLSRGNRGGGEQLALLG
jgi:hypothetical protein